MLVFGEERKQQEMGELCSILHSGQGSLRVWGTKFGGEEPEV